MSEYIRVPYGCSVHGEEEIQAVVEVLQTSTQMSVKVEEFEEKIRQWKVPSILIGILILTFLGPMFQAVEDMGPKSKSLYDERKNWSDIYTDVGYELDGKTTIVTGKDITMGLYSQTPCVALIPPCSLPSSRY